MHSRRDENGPKHWSELIGLRNALGAIAWRAVPALAVWTAIVWASTPGLAWIRANGSWPLHSILVFAAMLGGLLIAYILSQGVTEAAGFVSLIVTGMVCVAIMICIVAGSIIGSRLRGTAAITGLLNVAAIASGCGLAFVKTWLAE